MQNRRNILTAICLIFGALFTAAMFWNHAPYELQWGTIQTWSWGLLFPATILLVVLSGGDAPRSGAAIFAGLFIGGCASFFLNPIDKVSPVIPAAFFWALTVVLPIIAGSLAGWLIAYSGKRWMKK